ncbi:hypothetical protein BHE74_00043467, partial [Ensete ventricosum]
LYNQGVFPRGVGLGDLVLRKVKASDPTRSRGKLAPKWKGQYQVIEVVRDRTYQLGTIKGVELKEVLLLRHPSRSGWGDYASSIK